MGMDQYLYIPFLGEWTSIYQLFWCSPGVQGFDTLPYMDSSTHQAAGLQFGEYFRFFHVKMGEKPACKRDNRVPHFPTPNQPEWDQLWEHEMRAWLKEGI